MHEDKILWFLLLSVHLFEVNFSDFYELLDIFWNLISSCDLFWKLFLMDHLLPSKNWKQKHLSEQCWWSVHFDRVQSIEKLNPVKFKDELPQNFFPKEWCFLFAVEKDNSIVFWFALNSNLSHEELKVVDVELAVDQFFLAWRMLSSRYFTHVLLAEDLWSRSILAALIVQNHIKCSLTGCSHHFLQADAETLWIAKVWYLRLKVECAFYQSFY